VSIAGFLIPGTVSVALKSALELNLTLEKKIDFNISYSKHVSFNLPFEYNKKEITTPSLSNLMKVSETQSLDYDFSGFTQLPKFGSALTLTPILYVKLYSYYFFVILNLTF